MAYLRTCHSQDLYMILQDLDNHTGERDYLLNHVGTFSFFIYFYGIGGTLRGAALCTTIFEKHLGSTTFLKKHDDRWRPMTSSLLSYLALTKLSGLPWHEKSGGSRGYKPRTRSTYGTGNYETMTPSSLSDQQSFYSRDQKTQYCTRVRLKKTSRRVCARQRDGSYYGNNKRL